LILLCLGYFPTFGMLDSKSTQTQYHGLYELSQDFTNVIKQPPQEFINLDIKKGSDHRYEASGIYKLIPYYQRIFPEDSLNSRFIIQKHPMNGEWLLTEIYESIWHKTIFSFPKENENPIRDAIVIKAFSMLQEGATEMKKEILNLKEQVKSKNEKIKSLTDESKSLKFHAKLFNELKKQNKEKIEKLKIEFEQKLFEKENEIPKFQRSHKILKAEIGQQKCNEKKNAVEKEELKQKLDQFEKEFLATENEKKVLKSQVSNLQKLTKTMEADKNTFKTILKEEQQKLKNVKQELDTEKKEI